MNRKEKERKEFIEKYDKLSDLEAIRVQNFLLCNKIIDLMTLRGYIFLGSMGVIFISPLVFFAIFYLYGLSYLLIILFIYGCISIFGAFFVLFINYRKSKRDKKVLSSFLNKKTKTRSK